MDTSIFLEQTERSARVHSLVCIFNPLVTNGLSLLYHLDESIFRFRGIRSISFFIENYVSKQKSPRCDAAFLRRHIWGYSVCLCPIKRTPGLYGLTFASHIIMVYFTSTWLILTRCTFTFSRQFVSDLQEYSFICFNK